MSNSHDYSGRTVTVTVAAQGLGLEMARLFAAREKRAELEALIRRFAPP